MNNLILYANATVCLVCALRIANFVRLGRQFKRRFGLFAIILATAFFSVAVRTFWGVYNGGSVDIAEFAINLFYCFGLLMAKGNVAQLVRPAQTAGKKENYGAHQHG